MSSRRGGSGRTVAGLSSSTGWTVTAGAVTYGRWRRTLMADGGGLPSSPSRAPPPPAPPPPPPAPARRLWRGGLPTPVPAFRAGGAEPPIIAYGRGPRV